MTDLGSNCDSPGVGLPEDGVTVAGHDLARLEEAPHKLLHLVVGGVQADGVLHLKQLTKP